MEMHPFYQALDPCLIWCYRLTGLAALDFIIGTLVLAGISQIIGKVTVSLISLITQKRLGEKAAEADKYQNLSMDALKAGNKEAYLAANQLANEAFGHSFFQQAALSAAFLWPVFFALAWMQYRFLELEIPIPGTNWSLGFIGAFIILYVPAYLVLKRLPWFHRFREILERFLTRTSAMKGLVAPNPGETGETTITLK